MSTPSLGALVHGFFLDHLVEQKGLRQSSVRSYRDTLRLFLPFVATDAHRPISRLQLEDLCLDRVPGPRLKPRGSKEAPSALKIKAIALLRSLLVSTGAVICAACGPHVIRSEAGPTVNFKKGPEGAEDLRVGLVNGLWRHETAENEVRLSKHPDLLGDIDPVKSRDQCQVRVGFKRGYTYPVPFPGPGPVPLLLPFSTTGFASEYVLLPPGWKSSLKEVVNDGATINVGDIVEVRVQKGRIGDWLVRLIRKCNDAPAKGEPRAWKLGCRGYDAFDEHGYAGEKYYWTAF
jgi:hypothetical protein